MATKMFESTQNGLCFTKRFLEALKYDDTDLARSFLKRFCSQKIHDRAGRTPLHMAAIKGSNKCISLMIDIGYEVNQKDDDSKTPLMYAFKYENIKAVKVLMDNGGTSLLNDFLYAKNILDEMAHCYWSRIFVGSLINGMIKENVTYASIIRVLKTTAQLTYHAAVCSGSQKLVRLVHVEIENKQGEDEEYGVMHGMLAAIIDKNVDMIMLLHELGLDLKTKIDHNEHNLLTFAASQLTPDDQDYVEVIRALLLIGVDVNEKFNGMNGLQWIVKRGNLEAVRMVLSHTEKVKVLDKNNNTLMHLAVYNHDLDVLRYLISLDLKSDATNKDKKTVEDLAKSLQKMEALEVLTYSNLLD